MNTMKAALCKAYGPPEVISVKNVDKPVPGNNEILIKIMASAVNSGDTRVRGLKAGQGLRFIMRFVLGFFRPRKPILGTVFSGIVEQTGDKLTGFSPGDKVFGSTGFKFGTHAEYICLNSKAVVSKMPENATFEEATAILFGGQTAIYFLQKAGIGKKERASVLIYGAAGAVGTAAIQIAKSYGADVTAVCSSAGKEIAEKLGADYVIAYDREDFTQYTRHFDIIFDAVGKTSKKQCAPLLTPHGSYLNVNSLDFAEEKVEQLELLKSLFERGCYTAVIDKIFPLNKIVEAHRYVDNGRKKGNVVIKIFDTTMPLNQLSR